jgi:hypothetical protein
MGEQEPLLFLASRLRITKLTASRLFISEGSPEAAGLIIRSLEATNSKKVVPQSGGFTPGYSHSTLSGLCSKIGTLYNQINPIHLIHPINHYTAFSSVINE